MVDIQSSTAEIRQGKKKERRNHGKNIMSASATQGGHNNWRKKSKRERANPGSAGK